MASCTKLSTMGSRMLGVRAPNHFPHRETVQKVIWGCKGLLHWGGDRSGFSQFCSCWPGAQVPHAWLGCCPLPGLPLLRGPLGSGIPVGRDLRLPAWDPQQQWQRPCVSMGLGGGQLHGQPAWPVSPPAAGPVSRSTLHLCPAAGRSLQSLGLAALAEPV